jgi:hypothetical protein
MIQRIQSIWLFLSALLSGLLIKGGIVDFIDKSGQKFYTGFAGIYKQLENGSEVLKSSIPLASLIIAITGISIITIFLYKSRRLQKVLSLILVCLSLCLIILVIFYSHLLSGSYNAQLVPGVRMAFPMLILIFVVLAYSGISRDDRLVKSYDRLR